MASNRQVVFEELHTLVDEYDQCPNTEWQVDDVLSNLIIRLNGEIRRARKVHTPVEVEAI